MQERGWNHFAHEADLGVCGWGPTVDAAFEEAALALTASITDSQVVPSTCVDIVCEGNDLELLFVAWLNAIIYEMAVRKMLFGRFEAHITRNSLKGSLWGEEIDRLRHCPACEPKAATYTALEVSKDDTGRWTARCVVDV